MDFGISYFIVKFDKSKKEELLGISRTHMSKFDLAPPHELLKTWHWTSLQSWNVNWEVGSRFFYSSYYQILIFIDIESL